MNRIKLLLLSVICAVSASAQLPSTGYYRVQNDYTKRYITVIDGYGSANYTGRSVDSKALKTVMPFDEVACDPSSILYIKKASGSAYDIVAQGVNSYNFFSIHLKLWDNGDNSFKAYASKSFVTMYLYDKVYTRWYSGDTNYAEVTASEQTDGNGIDWMFLPLSSTNYFGIKPDVTDDVDYYKSFCAPFPFTIQSSGVTAYTVSKIVESKGVAVISEITGTIAGGTPVIFKCSSDEVSDNLLNITGEPFVGEKPIKSSGNELSGVFFSNTTQYLDDGAANPHFDAVAFDPSTMRVLGTANGKPAFVKDVNLSYIPANSAYITVSANAPDVLYLVDKEPEQQSSVTIAASNAEMIYGDEVPALTYQVIDGAPDGEPAISCDATSSSPVGTYPIKLSNGTLKNENIQLTDGTLTINKASLTISALDYTITEGDEIPSFELKYDGFKNDDTEDVLTVKPTVTCAATSGSEPGTYEILVSGAEAGNYKITYIPGVLTIKPQIKVLSLVADNAEMIYGDELPKLTYQVIEGEPDGEPAISCDATSSSPVGSYPIKLSKGTLKNDVIQLADGTLTISKASLTIRALDYTITEGDEIPSFELKYEGFKNNETETVLTTKPTVACDATSSSVAGTYDIIVRSAEANNYEINYVSGTLTITAKTIVVAQTAYTKQADNSVAVSGTTVSASSSCVIPSSVESEGVAYTVSSVAANAFKDNTTLEEVSLPETIKFIGSCAFAGCSNMSKLTVNSMIPPTLVEGSRAARRAASAFEGIDKENCILYVPQNCVEVYSAAEGWNEFKNILEIGSTAVEAITVNQKSSSDVYDLSGRKVRSNTSSLEGLSKGVYMIDGKKVVKN